MKHLLKRIWPVFLLSIFSIQSVNALQGPGQLVENLFKWIAEFFELLTNQASGNIYFVRFLVFVLLFVIIWSVTYVLESRGTGTGGSGWTRRTRMALSIILALISSLLMPDKWLAFLQDGGLIQSIVAIVSFVLIIWLLKNAYIKPFRFIKDQDEDIKWLGNFYRIVIISFCIALLAFVDSTLQENMAGFYEVLSIYGTSIMYVGLFVLWIFELFRLAGHALSGLHDGLEKSKDHWDKLDKMKDKLKHKRDNMKKEEKNAKKDAPLEPDDEKARPSSEREQNNPEPLNLEELKREENKNHKREDEVLKEAIKESKDKDIGELSDYFSKFNRYVSNGGARVFEDEKPIQSLLDNVEQLHKMLAGSEEKVKKTYKYLSNILEGRRNRLTKISRLLKKLGVENNGEIIRRFNWCGGFFKERITPKLQEMVNYYDQLLRMSQKMGTIYANFENGFKEGDINKFQSTMNELNKGVQEIHKLFSEEERKWEDIKKIMDEFDPKYQELLKMVKKEESKLEGNANLLVSNGKELNKLAKDIEEQYLQNAFSDRELTKMREQNGLFWQKKGIFNGIRNPLEKLKKKNEHIRQYHELLKGIMQEHRLKEFDDLQKGVAKELDDIDKLLNDLVNTKLQVADAIEEGGLIERLKAIFKDLVNNAESMENHCKEIYYEINEIVGEKR